MIPIIIIESIWSVILSQQSDYLESTLTFGSLLSKPNISIIRIQDNNFIIQLQRIFGIISIQILLSLFYLQQESN
ncbi:hypothetical protein pb186bvf_014426 [Paramecium bursaria]